MLNFLMKDVLNNKVYFFEILHLYMILWRLAIFIDFSAKHLFNT